jgi:hypothetical protein
MSRISLEDRNRQSELKDPGKQTNVGDWSDLTGRDLLVEFVDNYRAIMRITEIRKDKLCGVKLTLTPRDLRLEEGGTEMLVHKGFVKKISGIQVQIQKQPISIRLSGGVCGSRENRRSITRGTPHVRIDERSLGSSP